MKLMIRQIFLLAFVGVSLWSCKKDEVKTIAKTGQPGTLTATPTALVLSSSNAADTVQTFSWARADYGFSAAVRYTLQIAKGGTNFSAPKEISMGNNIVQKYTGADLNQMALILGLPPGAAGQLEARVKASISDSIPAIYSNPVTLSVTPYLVIINYPSLWVPGDYQGWDPATAPKISSKAANGIYEGYVNIPGGSLKFKFTSHPDWNHTNYGWASSTVNGSNVSGTFNTTGGDLFVPTTGYYLLKANTNTNTWEGIKTSWGLIGDAIPVTGWNSDQDLTYNATTKVWTVTLNLGVGKIKFRANDDWAINFGDTGADLSLEYGGSDISVTSAGNYTITLDLSVPGNYTYTVKKN
jgi:hypothetical protein